MDNLCTYLKCYLLYHISITDYLVVIKKPELHSQSFVNDDNIIPKWMQCINVPVYSKTDSFEKEPFHWMLYFSLSEFSKKYVVAIRFLF